ncbi:MAG: glucodextranase DOMON-like domain-containing protein [Anaerolineales bacterium]
MRKRWLYLILLLVFLVTACEPTPTPTPTPAEQPPAPAPTLQVEETPSPEDVLYLAIIWHQHQPVYYKDPETGIYAKPWVRLHAAKDYVDMAAMVEEYPDVHVAFNLTPSLIRQIDDLAAGAQDAYWVHTEIPAEELTEEEKRFILRYFFDINPKIIARFPRYAELQGMRPADEAAVEEALAGGWSTQDFRDLQLLFNLGWTDPAWLAEEPLNALVEKERDFTEEEKEVVLQEHLRLIREVIPVHDALQDAGQIEITMTPFAHPILPLLVDTNLAQVAMPGANLPVPPFRYGQDAVAQVERGVELYRDHFEQDPRGMWPAEGSVAQEIVNMVGRAGIRWMASDEGVLAKSLEMDGFQRDLNDTVVEADALYRPYTVVGGDGIPVAMVFRDVVISDKVGFTYSGQPGDAASTDFINRIHAIREQLEAQGAEGPNLVTVILDGENAWEHYENDGKEFLHTLYEKLAEDESIVTVTPSEYLEMFPEEPSREIADLWPGSWISHDFSTWIGEDEENRAWDYLRRVREDFQKYVTGVREPPSEEALEEARTLMYIAEGSDWFWWYGADQNSGSDEDFDRQFRDTLKQVYVTLEESPPDWLSVPIIAESPASPEAAATALITPTIDGAVTAGEWDAAGYYMTSGGAMAAGDQPLESLYYGFDARNLYLRVEAAAEWAALTTCGGNPDCRSTVGFYLRAPGGGDASAFSRWGGTTGYLGFGATRLLEFTFGNNAELTGVTFSTFDGEAWVPTETVAVEELEVAVQGRTLESAVPLSTLAPTDDGTGTTLDSGDRLQMRLVLSQGTTEAQSDQQVLPSQGPAVIVVPDLGLTTEVLAVTDPEGDDFGPGTYTYPQDAVFQPGAFDARSFSVGYDENNVVFRLTLAGPLENVWDSPNGLSIQTVDIYIDKDGPTSGARMLLPGRNAALTEEHAWDYAIWVEGWTPGLFVPGEEAPTEVDTELTIIADPGQSKITVKVPKAVLGDDPENWSYAAVVLGQEGFPAAGVWRVRDVAPTAEQWRFGGAPEDASHTRILDLVWPEGAEGSQESFLSAYTSAEELEGLEPGDFAQVPMISPE